MPLLSEREHSQEGNEEREDRVQLGEDRLDHGDGKNIVTISGGSNTMSKDLTLLHS